MKAIEYTCTVKSFKMLTPTVFETAFKTDKDLKFTAGQFVSVIIPGAGPRGRDLRRAYSIASPPEHPQIELCIKLVEKGPGTNYLYQLRSGDQFRVMAPYGDFVYEPKMDRNVCFISTGTGIAPFRSMILSDQFRSHPPNKAFCFLGVRTESELLYQDTLPQISNLEFVNVISQPSPSWNGYRGRVTQYFRDLGNDFLWLQTDFYLCGHGGMINEMKALLTEKGVAKEAIHQEVYYK